MSESPRSQETLEPESDELLAQVEDRMTADELEQLTPPSRFLLVRVIDRTVELLAATTLAAITGILFFNALRRYAFNAPLGWAEEIVTGLLLWLIAFGLYIATRRRDLIIIRVVVGRLRFRSQVWAKMVADSISAIVLTHLAWVGVQYVFTFGGDLSAYLRLPKGLFTVALPLGVLGVAVALVLQLRTSSETVAAWVEEDRTSAEPDALVPPVTTNRPGRETP